MRSFFRLRCDAQRAAWLAGGLIFGGCGSPDISGIFADDGSSAPTTSTASSQGGSGGTGAAGPTTTSGGGTQHTGGGAPVTCGDGQLDAGEACDGAALDGKTCSDLGFEAPGDLRCAADCSFDTSKCVSACGNGALEPGEKCDGTDLGGTSCESLGYPAGGTVVCAEGCTGYIVTGCGAPCGNGKIDSGEQCDGANLDGKNCQDFGFSAEAGLSCKACVLDTSGCKGACGNGVVEENEECDDGNAENYDACDSSCHEQGRECNDPINVALAPGSLTINGSTVGGGQHDTNGAANCDGATGPDLVYAIKPTQAGFVTARLVRGAFGGAATNFDSVLYARTECSGGSATGTTCGDSFEPKSKDPLPGGELVSRFVPSGGLLYLFVDGYNGAFGDFQLELDLSSGESCADPVPIVLDGGTPMRLVGRTTGFSNESIACLSNGAPDVVYAISRVGGGNVAVSYSAADFTTRYYVEGACGAGPEVACFDPTQGQPTVTFSTPAGGSTFFWVGGATGGNQGLYRLSAGAAP